MKHRLPPLDSLKAFESAARNLSFSMAAEELCITKSAVSYQIRKLEETLDKALFKRATRQVYLTDSGQILLQATRRLFDDLEQTFGQLAPKETDHDVYIGVTTYVALRWLSPRIAGFNQQYPDVSIVLQHSVNSEEFKLQDVDIAIRWGVCDGRKQRSRLLEMPMALYPVCSPGLLEQMNIKQTGQVLSTHLLSQAPFNLMPLLCEDRKLDLWSEWYGKQEQALSNPRRVITDSNVRTQAAIDGQGWTMADALMEAELASGVLVAPFAHKLNGYGYAFLASSGRYTSHKVRDLRDWLTGQTNLESQAPKIYR